MGLGLFPLRQLRYVKRYRQILQVLVKYGFAQVLAQINLYGIWERIYCRRRDGGGALPHNPEARLRMAVEELGPAYIKIGQLLSTRADLLPPAFTAELAHLQDDVPPFPYQKAKQIVEAELKAPLEQLFQSFDAQPLAAASIGQVHRAVLNSGEMVVVKIKRPGIDVMVHNDLDILVELASLVDRNTNLGPLYQFTSIAQEIRKIISRELDYHSEARNAQRLRQNLEGSPQVYVPRVYWEYTTRDILTLEYRQGINLSRYLQAYTPESDPSHIAQVLTETFFKQVFINGFFHGDPHPGNIALLPDGRLFFMDFGSAGFISEDLRGRLALIFLSFQNMDPVAMVDELLSFTFVPPVINRSELIRDIALIQEQYYEIPLKEINLSEALQDLMRVGARHHLRFPYEFLLLAKALLTLEGTVTRLDPDFKIAEAVQRYGPALQGKQFKFAARRLKGIVRSYQRLVEEIPERTVEILRTTAAGELKIKVQIDRAESALKTLENMVNRLAFSIVLASLVIGLSQNIRFTGSQWLEKVPVGEIALVGAGLAGLWWLFAIIRSGRL